MQRDSVMHLKAALIKYYALLHYTGIKHSVISSLLPIQPLAWDSSHTLPRGSPLVQSTLSMLSSLPSSLIRLILFTPPLLFYLPGYINGYIAGQLLGVPGEEESFAQYKAIGGLLGIATNLAIILGILWRVTGFGYFVLPGEGPLSLLRHLIGLAGTIYCSVIVLIKWHDLLVKGDIFIPFFDICNLLICFLLLSIL